MIFAKSTIKHYDDLKMHSQIYFRILTPYDDWKYSMIYWVALKRAD